MRKIVCEGWLNVSSELAKIVIEDERFSSDGIILFVKLRQVIMVRKWIFLQKLIIMTSTCKGEYDSSFCVILKTKQHYEN